MRKILFTKKDLDKKLVAKELGEKLKISFLEVLQIENIKIPTFDLKGKSLIFSSVNAVNSFFENEFLVNEDFTNKDFNRIYAVGKKSKKALIKKGFGTFKVKKNAHELAQFIIKNSHSENFLHFCGNIALDTLEKEFKEESIKYKKVVVYNTKLKYPIAKDSFDEIVFFSPSGVRSFLKHNSIEGKKVFSIGKTTSIALEKYTNDHLFTSQESTLEDVLQLINKKL